MSDTIGHGLCLLCLDGGPLGTTELTQLIALREVLIRYSYDKGLKDGRVLRPCDVFDMICGSGIGGLLSFLFVCLEMSVDKALEAYMVLYDSVFTSDAWSNGNTKAVRPLFEAALDEIASLSGHSTETSLDTFFSFPGKAFLCTLNATNVAAPRIFRTYKSREHRIPNCALRDALKASVADVSHLEAVRLGITHEEFVGAIHLFNNPISQLAREAASAFGPNSQVACIVSIGLGHPGPLSLPIADRDHEALLKIVQDCERQSEAFHRRCADVEDFYFRLSVSQGLQSKFTNSNARTCSLSTVEAHTQQFLQTANIDNKIERLVDVLQKRPPIVTTEGLNSIFGPKGRGQLSDVVTKVLSTVKQMQWDQEHREMLNRLKSDPRNKEGHDECLKGTRRGVLNEVRRWIRDSNSPNFFYLYGHPGTGKSTIATSVRSLLQEMQCLGGSFFFRRAQWKSQTPTTLWRSIAADLAERYPAIRQSVCNRWEREKLDPDAMSAHQTFYHFIKQSFMDTANATNKPIVIVIDALDECGGLMNHLEYQRKVLDSLADWQSLPLQCKLFITSRYQGELGSTLGIGTNRCVSLEVGKNATVESRNDIEKFFTSRFNNPKFTWLDHGNIKELAAAAEGLFIWASTVANIAERHPPRVLQKIIQGVRSGHLGNNLDGIYTTLLHTVFPKLDNSALSAIRRVIGSVVLAQIPLSQATISELLYINKNDIEYVCQSLQPVLSSHPTVSFLHQSFVDFLISDGCPPQFRCRIRYQEGNMAGACVKSLSENLHFNMGEFKSSFQRNTDIQSITTKVSESTYYSCRFWSSHIVNSSPTEAATITVLHFLKTKLLFWLEVMSIDGSLHIASKALQSLMSWAPEINVSRRRVLMQRESARPASNTIRALAQDAILFIRAFSYPIMESAPQVYLSALPLSPKRSLIRLIFSKSYKNLLRISSGNVSKWPAVPPVFRGHLNSVESVSFTPSGKHVVSASFDGTIRIWDVSTRHQVGLIQSHSRAISYRSICVSPDGRTIASGSNDHTVRIWDFDTLQQVGKSLQSGHTVRSVDFSPNGQKIASASDDGLIFLWDISTNTLEWKVTLESVINSISFSPDGDLIIVTSDYSGDQIYVRNAKSGELFCPRSRNAYDLKQQGPRCQCVKFMPDGKRIVACTRRDDILIFDTQQQIGERLYGLGPPARTLTSLAVSPDGKWIVAGSDNGTIQIWNAATRQHVRYLREHRKDICSLAFSPNGRHLLSGSADCSIRLWDLPSIDSDGHDQKHWARLTCSHAIMSHRISFGKGIRSKQLIRDDNGWVLRPINSDYDPDSQFMYGPRHFWIPDHLSARRTSLVGKFLGRKSVDIDLSKFCYGDDWTKCYTDKTLE